MRITRISPLTKAERTLEINVTEQQLRDAVAPGKLIQDVLAHLTPGEREFIMTGITDEDWKQIFADEEEED